MNRPAILPELDGLRAVAAYGIVATHVAFQTATGSAVLERFDGVRTFKIKVAEKGQSLDDDIARVAAVRAARPDARLRVDANRGWSVDEAVAAARALRLGALAAASLTACS